MATTTIDVNELNGPTEVAFTGGGTPGPRTVQIIVTGIPDTLAFDKMLQRASEAYRQRHPNPPSA